MKVKSGLIKFSQMLSFCAHSIGMPVEKSIYLMECQILYQAAHVDGMWDAHFLVGKLVMAYLESTEKPSIRGYCWYKANILDYGRPRVSIA